MCGGGISAASGAPPVAAISGSSEDLSVAGRLGSEGKEQLDHSKQDNFAGADPGSDEEDERQDRGELEDSNGADSGVGTPGLKDAIVAIEHQVSQRMEKVSSLLEEKLEHCKKALLRAPPRVAVLLAAAEVPEISAAGQGKPPLLVGVQLEVEAELQYFDKPCRLWVCGPSTWPREDGGSPTEVLLELEARLHTALKGKFAHDGPCVWPIQSPEHAFATLQLEELLLCRGRASYCRRALTALRILPPGENSMGTSFMSVLQAHFGRAAAYNYSWSCVWIQNLWIAGFISGIILCTRVKSPDMLRGDDDKGRIVWELCKIILCLWIVALPVTSRQFILQSEPLVVSEPAELEDSAQLPVTPIASGNSSLAEEAAKTMAPEPDITCTDPDHEADEDSAQLAKRYTMIVLCIVCVCLFLALVGVLFMIFVWSIMFIVYHWGECDTVDPPCSSPDGPDDKHFPLGTLAEISCDIIMAILFEAFIPVSKWFGSWLAQLLNHASVESRKSTAEVLVTVLASLERVSFLVILGMLFAPQWERPDQQVISNSFNMSECFQTSHLWSLFTGNSSAFSCIRSRLPYQARLHLFTKLVRGPFMVAPFVGIIVKIVIPLFVEGLDFWLRNRAPCRCCKRLLGGLSRVLSFIFVFDGDAVGGVRYLVRGWPFKDLRVLSPSTCDGSARPPSAVAASLDVCDPVLMALRRPRCLRRSSEGQQRGAVDDRGRRQHPAGPASPPSVGGIEEADVEAAMRASLEARLQLVLQQGARKPFEPDSELMQTRMNMLFVAFFVSVMPYGTIGVLVTLAAKLIELKCSLSKLVFVRRRVFPEPDRAMKRTQRRFVIALAAGIPAWSALLSLITYNAKLYQYIRDGTSASKP